MKPHLMYRNRDFDLQQPLPPNAETVTQDLELNTLLRAMAGRDEFVFQVVQQSVSSALENDCDTILYRQAILKDCLRNDSVVQKIYNTAVEAIEGKKKLWFGGILGHSSGSILLGAMDVLRLYIGILEKLKRIVESDTEQFESEGFATLFALIKKELTDAYFERMKNHLKELKFHDGVLISAQLGAGNESSEYVLRKSDQEKENWLQRIFTHESDAFTFRIAERDEAGFRALGEIKDRGINLVANALAQSADHILNFFVLLKTELAFYIACKNLHNRLSQNEISLCFPEPFAYGERIQSCAELSDVCLAIEKKQKIVSNDFAGDEKNLIIITGANQGGKSTFLRSIGVAQFMMQSGMFVTAESFRASICRNLFTHYKREEDATMQSGKFDEELSRMSEIIDSLTPESTQLFNESFASTNEREGSEIAHEIVRALLETGAKVFFVTHLYEFANQLCEDKIEGALFLRAERKTDGERTFKLLQGEPLQTSYGEDLYKNIFTSESPQPEIPL